MRFLASLALFLLAPSVAFAVARFERTITVQNPNGQPVFVAVPEDVTLYHPLETLRVAQGSTLVPHKTSASRTGELQGVISTVTMCSTEGAGVASALHDGSVSTTVRPDPLQDPQGCSIDVRFALPVRADRVVFDTDGAFKTLSVSAEGGNGMVALRTVKNVNSLTFSSVVTSRLQIDVTYDVVPTLQELHVSGAMPARILFAPQAGASYVLLYGDDAPPPVPAASVELAATATTPYGTVGSERIRNEDSDSDGLMAARDNCPFIANPGQSDSDSDGVGDVCDNAPGAANVPQQDRDQDGVGDATDNCPSHFNPDQKDEDLNGVGYVCDDADQDGIQNGSDTCPGLANRDQKDSDGNGVGDVCELDRDSDGIPDATDVCRSAPNPAQEDRDDDGIGDLCDSCPATANADQRDSDGNGVGDACEAAIQDPDGDGKNNNADNCPAAPNANQVDADADGRGDVCDNCPTIQNRDQYDGDKDGQGDVCTDADGDGLLPHIDNCPALANADQTDADNDGVGDACDDDDGDGVANILDNCRYASNRDQGDLDADGAGNACDEEDNRLSEQHPWVMWIGMTVVVLALLGLVVRLVLQMQRDQRREP